MNVEAKPETYLGDGLYASYDGHQIRLRAPRNQGDHEVFLEPMVMNALVQFVEDTFNLRIMIGSRSEGDFSAFLPKKAGNDQE